MPLIVKGKQVRLHVEGGRGLVRPSGAMMHDPSGRWWPKNSLLFGSFTDTGEYQGDYNGPMKAYLGRDYAPRGGYVNLPPKALSYWALIGPVTRIDYVRGGTKYPGGFRHHFNGPRGTMWLVFAVKGKGAVTLYRLGRFYRLELPRDAIVDDRGLAWP